MKKMLIVGFVLVTGAVMSAQTYGTSSKVTFNAPSNATTVALAQSLGYNLRIEGGSPIPLAGVVCSGTVPLACSAALPAAAATQLNTLGAKSVTLAAVDATAGEGAQSVPFVSAVKPGAPTGLTVTP